MSYKKKSSKFNGRQSNEVLKYCPNYKKYDKRARNGSKTRINQHLSERRGGIINCVNQAIKEFKILDISIKKDAPQFIDDDKIIQNAAKQTTIQINKWDGVQISQCKKIMIDTFEKFAKKAKNHQDQTSWKISGDYFFAPYIQKARLFLIKYCKYIQDINSNIVIEIEYLLCLSFANALLYQEIKFHRTKPKPLMRHRTLVKSNGIHRELEALHKILTITKFISIAKEKRKKECGKSNIIAIDFFKLLKKFVNIQYLKQKKKVYKLLNKPDNIYFENNSDFDDIDNKNSDINDDDHSVENDDIDMRSNSPSVTPPSIGGHGTYVYDNGKKCRKGKQRINTFQCTNNNKKYNHEKQDKYIHKKKINRQNKINKKTNAARKYCDTLQIRDVNAINVLNSDFCSDCNNDNSTVSTITSSNVSNSMSPIRISNTIHNYNNNNNNNNNGQSMFTGAFNQHDKIMAMKQENYELQKEIRALRFRLAQKRTHNHNPIPPTHMSMPPQMYNQYIRQSYVTYQMPQMQQPMNMNMGMGMEMNMELPPVVDNNNDDNDDKLLFPNGPMINDDNLYKPAPFDINQSTNMLPNISVDPFSSFNTTNMSPQPFNINSTFL